MSYRSIKRVLGERNIERKCRVLVGLLVVLGGIVITGCTKPPNVTQETATPTETKAPQTGEAELGVVTDPAIPAKLDSSRVLEERANSAKQIVNAAVLAIHWKALDKEFPVETLTAQFGSEDYDTRVIRPAVNNPTSDNKYQPRNDLEKRLLEQWEIVRQRERGETQPPSDTPKIVTSTAENNAVEYYADPAHYAIQEDNQYVYYQPVFITDVTCVVCHRSTNVNQELIEGDLQAIIQITRPTK